MTIVACVVQIFYVYRIYMLRTLTEDPRVMVGVVGVVIFVRFTEYTDVQTPSAYDVL